MADNQQQQALISRHGPGRRRWRLLVTCLALLAAPTSPSLAKTLPLAQEELPTEGQPEVVLDRLDFPKDLLGAATFRAYLEKILRREVRTVNWGAGRSNRIEYRFAVTELHFTLEKKVLKVRCTAVGRLPGGQTAKSDLTYGGSPTQRGQVVRQVLEIVSRGVITRLAEMERKRRGLE